MVVSSRFVGFQHAKKVVRVLQIRWESVQTSAVVNGTTSRGVNPQLGGGDTKYNSPGIKSRGKAMFSRSNYEQKWPKTELR